MDAKLEAMHIVVNETLEVIGRLSEYYETDECIRWMRSPHHQLGGETATAMIATGRVMEVCKILDRLDADGYV
ncbi:MAG: MbcA/ParS/Xre antitoxin family protein [Pseudomonadota bacterium]